ncbi:excalibur calcium-binding domain-containing protein [Pseudomonas sp. LRF_L74]|uniref:excalibur calcium-binding domain-containing protein n=1 Tax=Pseudomonas sp. LRF_L74 TaxID=3369422 RepID=UPI003F5E68FE
MTTSSSVTAAAPQVFQTPKVTRQAENFSCDGRQHCSQMRSRAEAEYFLRNCPNTKMDGDHDGIPCENDSRF